MTAVSDFDSFVSLHRDQLETSLIPERLWRSLHQKLIDETYDAGDCFTIMMVVDDGADSDDHYNWNWKVLVTNTDGVTVDDPNCIFLVDHAWSYSPEKARAQLRQVPALLNRMAGLMGLSVEGKDSEQLVDEVFQETWKYSQFYEVYLPESGDAGDPIPIWYIMDEFGSRIQHSDQPSFCTAPFYFSPRQISYSLLWPVTDLDEGDEVTRDYIGERVTNDLVRKARGLPWIPRDMTTVDCSYVQLGTEYYEAHFVNETLPELARDFPPLSRDRPLRVFTDESLIHQYLNDQCFQITDDIQQADIVWMTNHYKNFRDMSTNHPHRLVNQFPCEFTLTYKNLLAVTCRDTGSEEKPEAETLSRRPAWLPVTYVLKQELPQFVSYFQQREQKGLDNAWICKPWNLARGLDTHITTDLNHVVRLTETGPKVACKYIHDPVLFSVPEIGSVKFDIRYVVCLSSVRPLALHAYNVFWLRFANKEYSLDNFDDYQKHFTVMNYDENSTLRQINYDDFIPLFNSQYADYRWDTVEKQIFAMLREMFELAVRHDPPRGICPYPQSRALYAVDLMLAWKRDANGAQVGMQPMVCEVNFMPDNTRGCKYHPNFYNHMFNLLFLGVTDQFTEIA